jgi:perosamine synthetase
MIPIAKPLIGEEEKKAVCSVLDSGIIAQGPRVKEFEEAFASFIGTKFAVATSSGTTALCAALHSLGIKSGDEVITTPFTFIATANSILHCGAKPVFVDVDAKTFNIDPKLIAAKISPKTKALLIVHLFGQPCDMQPILDICKKHNLKLIEDCCQAHGAEYKSKKVGSFGDCGVFSFYPTKNMTTCEGGIIVTNDEKLVEACKLYRDHGSKVKYLHETIGFNLRMTDVSAAIGLVQLKKLNEFNKKRLENAVKLTNNLKNIKGVITPHIAQDVLHVFNQYTVRIKPEFGVVRDAVMEKLKQAGIGANIYYPIPIHKQPFYQKLGYADVLPETEKAAQEVLSIPVHPSLSEQDINAIASALINLNNKN